MAESVEPSVEAVDWGVVGREMYVSDFARMRPLRPGPTVSNRNSIRSRRFLPLSGGLKASNSFSNLGGSKFGWRVVGANSTLISGGAICAACPMSLEPSLSSG